MKVELTNKDTWESYTVTSASQCKDSTDKEVFNLVEQFNDVITMGCMIGEPKR